jgi:hypothetical protein
MKITSLRFILAVGALGVIFSLNNAYPQMFVTASGVIASSKSGKEAAMFAFPDVCLTPPSPPGGPIPVPYPNTVRASASDFGAGTKTTKVGEKICFKATKVKTSEGDEPAFEVKVVDKAGREVLLDEPKLFQLSDRMFCAVCVENGLLTSILELWLVTQSGAADGKRPVAVSQ